jgi:hypothetical protein|tara:strand:+ start:578 stop:775 length:198 start_codon:yes stop_codon:yes gene_type:complete
MDWKNILGHVELLGWLVIFGSTLITLVFMFEPFNTTFGRGLSATGLFAGLLIMSIGKLGLSHFDD